MTAAELQDIRKRNGLRLRDLGWLMMIGQSQLRDYLYCGREIHPARAVLIQAFDAGFIDPLWLANITDRELPE